MKIVKTSRLKIWIFSLLSAALMLVLTFYWLSRPYTFGDEAALIRWSALFKKSVLQIDPKPDPEEVLFVDVSGIKTTIDGVNTFGEPSPYYREVITDRTHLAAFFRLLNRFREDVRFVVCDILFDKATPADLLLQQQLDSLDDRLLAVSHLASETEHLTPVLDIPYAPATYQASDGMFLKYPLLLCDSLKTAPVVLCERLHGRHFKKGSGFFHYFDQHRCLPNPIIDFKVRPGDFRVGVTPGESVFTVFDIGTILESQDFMTKEDLAAYFSNRVIVIGDFETDIHETSFGEMPGPLILYNAYLTLAAGEHLLSPVWVILLFAGYFFLSYRILAEVDIHTPAWMAPLFRSRMGRLVLNTLDEIVILAGMTILSYMLFHIHINILIFLLFAKGMEIIWRKWPFWSGGSPAKKCSR
jgi:hypothetical protein